MNQIPTEFIRASKLNDSYRGHKTLIGAWEKFPALSYREASGIIVKVNQGLTYTYVFLRKEDGVVGCYRTSRWQKVPVSVDPV